MDEYLPIALPLAAALLLAAGVWATLWKRDRQMPVFDVGAIFTLVLLLYTVVPLAGYLAGGLAFTVISDARLLPFALTAKDLGWFSLRYIVYFAAFASAYLYFRRSTTQVPSFEKPDMETGISVATWALLIWSALLVLWLLTGATYSGSHDDLQATANIFAALPLVVQQFGHNFDGILRVLKIALLVLLFASYSDWRCRWAIFLWLFAEAVISVLTLGAKTPLLVLLIASVVLYHRFVRRLTFGMAALFTTTAMAFVFTMGFIRNYLGADEGEAIWTASNEFQALLATGYDVADMMARGVSIPWQIHIADVLRLIPQQILPFQKVEPSDWYLQQIGLEQSGMGFMFGAIAENIASGNWTTSIIRGALVGFLFATAHNWYVKRQASFYVTLCYLWLCIHAYYCFRASMLYITVWIAYRLIPALLLIAVGREAVKVVVQSARRPLLR